MQSWYVVLDDQGRICGLNRKQLLTCKAKAGALYDDYSRARASISRTKRAQKDDGKKAQYKMVRLVHE